MMNNVENNNLTQSVIDLQADKEGAFDEVYKKSFKAAYSFASVMLKNAEDIEDVLQISYMYVAQNIKALKSPESFLSWLHVIVRHECQKHISKKTKAADLFLLLSNEESKEPVQSYDEISAQILEQGAVRDAVKNIVDGLSPEKRICVVLHYYEQLTIPEIATELGVPEGTVKSRLHSARNEIEKKINRIKKKDNSLFGISAMPIILAFLKSQAETVVVPLAVQESIIAGIAAGEGIAAATAAATAGSAAAEVGATALGTGVGSVTGAAAGSAVAAKVVAVSLAAVVATGGSVVAAKTIMENTTRYIAESSSEIHEESTTHPYSTDALIFAMGFEETTFAESEGSVSETKITNEALTVTSDATKPVTTKAGATTTKVSTTKAPTTFRQTTTQPTTEKQTTTRPITTKPITTVPATTAAPTTSADDVYAVSGGVLSEYSGNGGSISIPSVIDSSTVTAIGTEAFSGNAKITAVTLPSTVTKIGTLAFADCSKLGRVNLPSSLVSIGSGAFCGCTALSNVSIPSGVMAIGDDAFDGCSSLTSVTIPDSVTEIGINVFGGCDSLTIKCSEGSAAHDYAVENSIDFELI